MIGAHFEYLLIVALTVYLVAGWILNWTEIFALGLWRLIWSDDRMRRRETLTYKYNKVRLEWYSTFDSKRTSNLILASSVKMKSLPKYLPNFAPIITSRTRRLSLSWPLFSRHIWAARLSSLSWLNTHFTRDTKRAIN